MRRVIVWLLVVSVVTASLVSINQCPSSHQIVLAGTLLAVDGHANSLPGSGVGKTPLPFSLWPCAATSCTATAPWRMAQLCNEDILPHVSALIAPDTPPPRGLL
ncbi:MAG: hypothetical protein H6650_07630 [Ardenticatenales bacterium]|nr:hypothetical protein [Ardenticatenales bacterium]